MRSLVTVLLYLFGYGRCTLWPKGVVHYAINSKHYDIHSQEEITSTFQKIQREVCVKFFSTPSNYSPSAQNKLLYVTNPDKRKTCPRDAYNYSGNVLDMIIGYKCLNTVDIARIVVDMLKASIEPTVEPVNSVDLINKFQERDRDPNSTLLSPEDRNYINAHYHSECGSLAARAHTLRRRSGDDLRDAPLRESTAKFYKEKLWPLGVVMYTVEPSLRGSKDHGTLNHAMTSIELSSCIVFQFTDMESEAVLQPRNMLTFASDGQEVPQLGFKEGNQELSLSAMTHGAPGHAAHAHVLLLRALGVPMTSNRYDRDNFVLVNWRNVDKGKEHLLEKAPEESWVPQVAYDFDSVSHAPANYVCAGCRLGAQTVQPIQDHLWQRTLAMGHKTVLSDSDKQLLNFLYGKECENRFLPKV